MLDFSQGPGHREQFVVGQEGEPVDLDSDSDPWGDRAS